MGVNNSSSRFVKDVYGPADVDFDDEGERDAYYGSDALDLLKALYAGERCFELLRKTERLP